MAEDETPDVEETDVTPADDTPEVTEVAAKVTPKPPVIPQQGGSEGWKPPTRAEHDAMARELRIAVKEAKERKARLAELEVATASEAEKALIEARATAAAERDAAWKPAVVTARAEAALASAGCTDPTKQELMLRLIDQAVVELDERGKVVGGLAEQVEVIRKDFPDAFTVPKVLVPSAREVGAGDKKPPAVKKTATQQAVDRLYGKS